MEHAVLPVWFQGLFHVETLGTELELRAVVMVGTVRSSIRESYGIGPEIRELCAKSVVNLTSFPARM